MYSQHPEECLSIIGPGTCLLNEYSWKTGTIALSVYSGTAMDGAPDCEELPVKASGKQKHVSQGRLLCRGDMQTGFAGVNRSSLNKEEKPSPIPKAAKTQGQPTLIFM